MRPHALHLFLAASAIAPAAPCQFMNRALWLGEDEGLRRDYRQDEDYFIDRASYVDAPPWWRAGSLDPFVNRVSIAGGSVSTTALTLESSLQLGVDLGQGFKFRMQQLGSEHQSTRFQRHAVGLELETSDSSAVLFQLEGDAEKARADMSFGLELLRSDHSAHRILFTRVDWPAGKSDVFTYDQRPFGVMAAGWHGPPDGWQVAYDVGVQLPLEERELATDDVLELERTIASAELRIPVGERDRLVLGYDGELTSKAARTADPASLDAETGDVSRGRVRLDWWHAPPDGIDTSIGVWFHHLDEDYERPNDLAGSLRVRRRAAGITTRMRVPLDERWSFEPYLIAGRVELAEVEGGLDTNLDPQLFQGKLGTPALFRFSESAWLRFDLSLQIDRLGFGGGGVQLQLSF